MARFNWAPAAYRQLNGILCVYKPAELPTSKLVDVIQWNLARDLNALPCYKMESQMRRADPTSNLTAPMVIDESSPVLSDDVLEHRLVLGQRYAPTDIRIRLLHPLLKHSSGVLLLGVGRGIAELRHIALSRFMRVYHVRGRFGFATHNFSPKGKIIERTSYRHINQSKIDRVCASVQSSSRIRMLKYAGIDLQSQEAYELSASGLLRPADGKTPPVLYSTQCVEFQLPDFTLEISCINEFCDYFMNIIHDVGLQLRSTAVCTGIRRLRYGHFDLTHALLRKHWTLEHIIDNLRQNRSQLTADKLCAGLVLQDEGQSRLAERTNDEVDSDQATKPQVERNAG